MTDSIEKIVDQLLGPVAGAASRLHPTQKALTELAALIMKLTDRLIALEERVKAMEPKVQHHHENLIELYGRIEKAEKESLAQSKSATYEAIRISELFDRVEQLESMFNLLGQKEGLSKKSKPEKITGEEKDWAAMMATRPPEKKRKLDLPITNKKVREVTEENE